MVNREANRVCEGEGISRGTHQMNVTPTSLVIHRLASETTLVRFLHVLGMSVSFELQSILQRTEPSDFFGE